MGLRSRLELKELVHHPHFAVVFELEYVMSEPFAQPLIETKRKKVTVMISKFKETLLTSGFYVYLLLFTSIKINGFPICTCNGNSNNYFGYDGVHVEPINNSFYRLTENIWGGSHNLLITRKILNFGKPRNCADLPRECGCARLFETVRFKCLSLIYML